MSGRCRHSPLTSVITRHPAPPPTNHPPKTKSMREMPKTTLENVLDLITQIFKDCQPFIQWTTFKTLKHFESSVEHMILKHQLNGEDK